LRWAGSASGLVGDKRLAKLYRYKGLECGQGRPAVRPLLARSKLGDVRRRLRPGPGCPANRGRAPLEGRVLADSTSDRRVGAGRAEAHGPVRASGEDQRTAGSAG